MTADNTGPYMHVSGKLYSSYADNNYGEVFETLVKQHDVRKVVELGVLYGYSTIHLATGLAANKKRTGVNGHLDAYDLWESYPYRHTTMTDTQAIINENGLQDYITLNKGDAFEAHNNHADGSVCLLHVDISNTGETIRKIMHHWHSKIRDNGFILFEGGSVERDKIEWMVKYNKPPLRHELFTNPVIEASYKITIDDRFPSLTVLHKNKNVP